LRKSIGIASMKQMPCTLHSCRDKIVWHSPSLPSGRRNERVQVAWGDGSLSRPTQALIFLPTDISLPRRRKYVKLRGYVDYDISDVPVWRTGDFDRPISTFKQHSAQHEVSHFGASSLYKSVQQFKYHMVTALVNNTEFPRK